MRIGNKKTIKKADAILAADAHIRETSPKCRLDDYYAAQRNKLIFINRLQAKHSCDVYIAGDLFDVAKPPLELINEAIACLPDNTIAIPGQHDLPSHSIDNVKKSGIGILKHIHGFTLITNNYVRGSTNKGISIYGFPYGSDFKLPKFCGGSKKVALVHTLLQQPKGANTHITYEESCKSLLKKLPGFDLIVSGDNHKPFTYRKGNQLIVNPGSMMRMDADQVDHKPRVYLWYAATNTVEPVYLPIEEGAVSRDHIEKKQQEDQRMDAYRDRLKAGIKMGVSFEKNMSNYIRKNKIKKSVTKEIYNAMEVKQDE